MKGPVIDNPKPQVLPEGENATPLEVIGATASDKLIIIMVGLPGTGKTHVSRRICRYISFFHDIPSQIFNVGEYRRKMLGAKLPASFYDHSNKEYLAKRKEACDKALSDLIEYMNQDGFRLGVYDATNSTPQARKLVLQKLDEAGVGAKKIFMEVICDDDNVMDNNVKGVQHSTPDYEGVDPDEAVLDFQQRRKMYMDVYKEVEDSEGSYVKIRNYHKFVMHNIRGYLSLKVCVCVFVWGISVHLCIFISLYLCVYGHGRGHGRGRGVSNIESSIFVLEQNSPNNSFTIIIIIII